MVANRRETVVKTLSSAYVTPAEPTPSHSIWLSNLDVLGSNMCYTTILNLYKPTGNTTSFFQEEALATSLSKVLVPFYPFAGELGYNDDDGRVELKCTGKGVCFSTASCEVTMDEFGDFSPSPALGRLLIVERTASATPPCPAVLFQVTYFNCGSVCVGMAVHHLVADGTAALQFINAWADVTRGVHPSEITPPFLDRSLLNARSPPSIHFDHHEYDLFLTTATRDAVVTTQRIATATLQLSKSQVSNLKTDGAQGSGGKKLTTYSAVVAHAWKCACMARRLDPNSETRLYIYGNIRSRLRPPLPAAYLGNAILYMRAEATADEVVAGSVADVGQKIELAKAHLRHDEYLNSLIDYVHIEEKLRQRKAMLPCTDLVAIEWLSIPNYFLDFGWGTPFYVNQAEIRSPGYMYVHRNLNGEEGAVLVTIALEEEFMSVFKKLFYEKLDVAD